MNKANYLSTELSTGGSGKYPLSVETLDFIQEQIAEVEKLAVALYGDNAIIKLPSNGKGIIIINSKVMPLSNENNVSQPQYFKVTSRTEDIVVDGVRYSNAREYNEAVIVEEGSYDTYSLSSYPVAPTMDNIIEQLRDKGGSDEFIKRIEDLEAKYKNLKTQGSKNNDKDIEDLKAENKELRDKVNMLIQRIGTQDSRISFLENRIGDLERTNATIY